jgi:hypothetical protein
VEVRVYQELRPTKVEVSAMNVMSRVIATQLSVSTLERISIALKSVRMMEIVRRGRGASTPVRSASALGSKVRTSLTLPVVRVALRARATVKSVTRLQNAQRCSVYQME